ncbi:MAG: hypothetical protein ACM34O_16370 [Ignavibacteria bacterium]
MDLLKQYITQTISSASNNLRLSTEKIEVVALLRQAINQSGNLSEDLKKMKTITELSKLAIKLNEIYNFLSKDQVDFQKLSDKFREHSQYLIKDISQMLDSVSPASFKILLDKIRSNYEQDSSEKKEEAAFTIPSKDIHEEFPEEFPVKEEENQEGKNGITESEKKFKEKILQPIRHIDDLLKKMASGSWDEASVDDYLSIVKENGTISSHEGYRTVADMHDKIYKAFRLFKSGRLKPTRDVTESLRACLIVIATLIRNKEVDIKNYLNLAEEFGKKIETLKQDEN